MASAEAKHAEEKGGEQAKQAAWQQIDFSELELGERIGGGGVGIIYSGTWNGQPVALKTLFDPKVDEQLMQEYLDELLVMSQLKHPNIVEFLGASMTPPNLCIVMELCDQSLYHMLHQQRLQFSTYERVQISLDVAQAMDYLHSREPSIIHRDLKSHNLLVSSKGVVKLCDFGLVRAKTTQAGTPVYMAPELLENAPYNKSVDVYSFAVLLWEVFAQELPLSGYDLSDIRRTVCGGERMRIPTVDTPPEIRELIADCWAHRPADRPEFGAVVNRLTALLQVLPQHSSLEELEGGGDFGGDALDDLLCK